MCVLFLSFPFFFCFCSMTVQSNSRLSEWSCSLNIDDQWALSTHLPTLTNLQHSLTVGKMKDKDLPFVPRPGTGANRDWWSFLCVLASMYMYAPQDVIANRTPRDLRPRYLVCDSWNPYYTIMLSLSLMYLNVNYLAEMWCSNLRYLGHW